MKKESFTLLLAIFLVLAVAIVASYFTGFSGLVTKTRNSTCLDSDNGYNLYLKGTCSYEKRSFTDYCSSEKVVERFCSNLGCSFNVTKCPTGYTCRAGECVDTTLICDDSDKGINIYEKGYCRDSTGTKTDRCGQEWFCTSKGSPYCVSKIVRCPEGTACTQDAVCVPK